MPDRIIDAEGDFDASPGRAGEARAKAQARTHAGASGGTCVFVAGMHRSGTSLVAGLLSSHWQGAPRVPLDARLGNETGHWEPKRLVVFNETLLRACGTVWDDASPLPPLEDALGPEVLARYRARAGELLRDELDGRAVLVFKDPRLCRLLPFWLEVTEACGIASRVVHPLRHPAEVSRSLDARNGMSAAYAERLWLRHVLDAERASRGILRAFVTYDAVLQDWVAVEAGLRETLGIDPPRGDAGTAETVRGLLRPELRHHHTAPADEAIVTPEILRAHRLLTEAARTGAPPEPETLQALEAWLDGPALAWSVVGPELVARRTILETWVETPDTLTARLKTEADVFGPLDREVEAGFGDAPGRLLPLEIRGLPAPRRGTEHDAPSASLVSRFAETRLREALDELDAVKTSRSWTMTRPLREGGRALRRRVLHPLVRGLDHVRVACRIGAIKGRHAARFHAMRVRHALRVRWNIIQRALWNRVTAPSAETADLARYMDVLWYRDQVDGLPLRTHPADHYARTGHREGYWPTPWFDPETYRAAAEREGVALAPQADPFAHFLREGARQGLVAAPQRTHDEVFAPDETAEGDGTRDGSARADMTVTDVTADGPVADGVEGDEADEIVGTRREATLEAAHAAALAVAADILLSDALPAGWRVEGVSDVRIEDGAFVATGPDPQILFKPGRGLPAGVHEITLRHFGADRLIPTLYFDVGQGFKHEHATVVLPEGRGHNACVVDLPARARRVRLDPFEEADRRFGLTGIETRHVPLADLFADRVRRRMGEVEKAPVPVSLRDRLLGRPRPFSPTQPMGEDPDLLYQRWIALFDDDAEHAERLAPEIEAWTDRPRVSVLMPVYNPPIALLDAAIQSVADQVWPDWELCIANDASSDPHVAPLLDAWAAREPRIRVVHRPENGHISHASNSALELVTGEWLALLDHDDILRPHALAEAMLAVRDRPDAALIYSDEDKIDDEGKRFSPFFKPDFSPDLLRSQNYLNHLTVHRTARVREAGGWRPGYEGSQDYDLNLRVTEGLDPCRVVHVPKILYHWRATAGSTAAENDAKGYAYEAGLKALRDAIADAPGQRAEPMADVPFYRVIHALPEPAPKVTLIIPTKDRRDLLELCVSSILTTTDYPDFELIVVDNGSSEEDALAYLAEIETRPDVRVLRHPHPFNYSEINNRAAAEATGDILGLVNNDIEVLHADWMREMAAQASRPEIGCVGAKLYYPNDTIQHGGVVMGVGGVAGHASINLPRVSPGYFGRMRVVHDVTAVTAACLFVRRAVYEEVGGLDAEKLKVAFNDVDFCLKVRAAGYRNIWTPFAELYHHESASRGSDFTEEKRARFMSEIDTMVERWPDALKADPYYNPNLRGDVADYTPRRL